MLAVALCGCKSEPPDCSTVGSGVQTFWLQRATVATTNAERIEAEQMAQQSAQQLVTLCKSDDWSAEAMVCVRAAVEPLTSGCLKYLTREQVGRLKALEPPMPSIPGGLGVGN